MSKGIGGYMRRSERSHPAKPDPDYWLTHCGWCGANLSVMPQFASGHICKEITYQTMPALNFIPFDVGGSDD